MLLVAGCGEKDPLTDGSFESPRAKGAKETFPAGSKIGAWEVHDAPVDLVANYWNAPAGAQSIHLHGGDTKSWIARDVPTIPGHMYTLRLAISANPDDFAGDRKLEVWWGDQLLDTIAIRSDQKDRNLFWKYITFNVAASGKSTRIRFGAANDEDAGPAIDDVKVTVLKQ
jgi:hypothetical protein